MKRTLSIILLLQLTAFLYSQSLFEAAGIDSQKSRYELGGSVYGTLYMADIANSAAVATGISGFALKFKTLHGSSIKGYIDLRYRYGIDQEEIVSKPALREAYAGWYTKYTEIVLGQQVVKWSRSDFYRLSDKINPRNDLLRTPDDSERDLGNLMLNLKINPAEELTLQFLYIPFNRFSTLPTNVTDITDAFKITGLPDMMVPGNMGNIGVKADLRLNRLDIALGWYSGNELLPVIEFDTLLLPLSPSDPPPEVRMSSGYHNINMFSSGFELVLGRFISRSEIVYTRTSRDIEDNKNIPFSTLAWTLGMEPSCGNLSLIMEYRGQYVIDYTDALTEPVFSNIESIPPGIQPEDLIAMIEEQLGSFNRLYNYQLDRYNHSLAVRAKWDNNISLIKPELRIMYNITTSDLFVNPLLNIKPVDNLTMVIGTDIYSGRSNSLYDLINDRLNSLYIGIKIDF